MRAPQSAASDDRAARTIVIGLGSPHGDDQAGWLLADHIARRAGPTIVVRNVAVPVDLLPAFESCGRAILLDAVRGTAESEPWLRWEWPAPEIARAGVGGTHALGLAETLELAQSLGQLPASVVIWGVCGERFSPGQELSPSLRHRLPDIADAILAREQLPLRAGV